jgi:hypothetical protein
MTTKDPIKIDGQRVRHNNSRKEKRAVKRKEREEREREELNRTLANELARQEEAKKEEAKRESRLERNGLKGKERRQKKKRRNRSIKNDGKRNARYGSPFTSCNPCSTSSWIIISTATSGDPKLRSFDIVSIVFGVWIVLN